ncbi:MAG TPA: EAL domain-containing protein [Longimicrobiales bacterium]|nr:EAL domain-containing protein [Longimicrobiales bacterium]
MPPDADRRFTPVHAVLGALFAGTVLFLVPTLALAGATAAAVFAAILWLGGLGLLLFLLRRDGARNQTVVRAEQVAGDLFRTLIEKGGEAFVVLEPSGEVRFTSDNIARVLGIEAQRLRENGGLLDMVSPSDRRRALQALSTVRRATGATASIELRAWRPDGSEGFLDVRATNLSHHPAVGGILIGLRDITPRKTFETEIQHLAFYDALTGLANRRFFFEQGTKALALARRHNLPAAILYIDLDRFKQVNDTFGHERGDALLKRVAECLRRCLRDSDVVARMGGDEFAVILTEVRDLDATARVAQRLLDEMPGSAVAEGHDVAVAASIGVAMFPEDGEDLEELLKAADVSMYRAKSDESGIQFYRPELRNILMDQLRLEQDMKRALDHHEFHLHYQPVFHLLTGEMAGAEALSRWRHFTRGMVAAAEFIQLAERSGLVRSLDRWAIARAIHQRKTLLDSGWIGWVAVNLSPHSLTDPDLATYIRETLEGGDLEPGALVLEMPGAAILDNVDAAADLMWEIKNTGAAIALDDYGAGSTSFGHLRRLPIDILKLAPEFIRGIGSDAGDERVVEGTISIAHGLRAKVLAKGVEREEQVEWLREAGCDFIQGYLMGAPMAPEDLQGDLRRPAESPESRTSKP